MRKHLTSSTYPGEEGGVLPYMGYIGMCHCEGYGFQAVYSGIGYISKSESWVLEKGIIFQETDQLPLKNIKKLNRFCFGWTVLVTSLVSGKQLI